MKMIKIPSRPCTSSATDAIRGFICIFSIFILRHWWHAVNASKHYDRDACDRRRVKRKIVGRSLLPLKAAQSLHEDENAKILLSPFSYRQQPISLFECANIWKVCDKMWDEGGFENKETQIKHHRWDVGCGRNCELALEKGEFHLHAWNSKDSEESLEFIIVKSRKCLSQGKTIISTDQNQILNPAIK